MKKISAGLTTHIQGEVTTLATCWLVVRPDGTRLLFCDHDQNIVVSGLTGSDAVLNGTYLADSAYTRSAIETSSDLSVDNVTAEGILDSSAITDDDIRHGKYDGSTIYLFEVNWANLGQGVLKLRKGSLGEIKILDYFYSSELRGLAQKLTQHIVEQYSAECRAVLGDARCKVNIEALKQAVTVTTVTDRQNFAATAIVAADEYFQFGFVKWKTGANAGLNIEVKHYTATGDLVQLYLPMPFDILVGDTFDIYPGCDLKASTCKNKFNNLVNMRAEPFVPVVDQVMSYPNDKTQVNNN